MTRNRNTITEFTVLFLLLALLNACAPVEGALPVYAVGPIIAEGEVLALQPGCTYHWLSEVIKNGGEVWASPNMTHWLVRWAVPGWENVRGIALVNTFENTAKYWLNLRGGVTTGSDADSLIKTAENLGWIRVNVKDLGITPLAAKVAEYGKIVIGAAASGEVLFSGAAIQIDIFREIIETGEDL